MRKQKELSVAAYSWHQFTIEGIYHEDEPDRYGYTHGRWLYPIGLIEWLNLATTDFWAVQTPNKRIPLFIKSHKDARAFKLVWDEYVESVTLSS